MSDNVNIIVQDTINEIVVNSAVIVETIDINVQVAVDEVTIIANPNEYIINVNRIIGEQVQSDWNETDDQAPDYIKNKPIIPVAVTKTSDLINDGEDGINPFITLEDIPVSGLTSVGLSMPVAFNVANSPLTSDGTIAVSAAGTSSQYIRGDGQLATLPSGGGGGSSVNYYLNGSIAASVATYKQLSNTAIIGGGTDFTLTGNGLITQFLTDVGNPNRLQIPSGAWNFEMFFSMSSSGGTPKFYVELLKYNGATFTTIANNSAVPETISGGTSIDLYLTSLAVPETTLLLTDRLAIRVYIVNNSGGRTATLHTENSHLCQIITTFASGIAALNGLTSNNQYLTVGTSGTNFNISSVSETHTFNLPTASAINRGALSTTDWTAFNGKFNLPSLTSGSVLFSDGTTIVQNNAQFFWDNTNNRLGIGKTNPDYNLDVSGTARFTLAGNKLYGLTLSTDAGGITYLSKIGTGANLMISGTRGINIDATNNVGIGITGNSITAATKLSVWTSGNDTIPALGAWGGKFSVVNSGSNGSYGLLSGVLGSGNAFFQVQRTDGTATAYNLLLQPSGGNLLINTTTDNGGKLQIKAGGALSTDIALRVRNSADTGDLFNVNGLGNVGIGTTAPVASAKVQVDSTTQGFLPPRMTNAQRLLIATPAVGLMVYCTDVVEGLYINKSTGWTFII